MSVGGDVDGTSGIVAPRRFPGLANAASSHMPASSAGTRCVWVGGEERRGGRLLPQNGRHFLVSALRHNHTHLPPLFYHHHTHVPFLGCPELMPRRKGAEAAAARAGRRSIVSEEEAGAAAAARRATVRESGANMFVALCVVGEVKACVSECVMLVLLMGAWCGH